jgi:type IV secretory pathway VirB2 component (pilin)
MQPRSFGLALAAVGIVVVTVAALGNQIGLGESDAFGWKQILGVVVGVVIAFAGFAIATRGEKPADDIDTAA